MTDRPILFSAPMVRALLGGRKTQTRRMFKALDGSPITGPIPDGFATDAAVLLKCPYGVSGDVLWVREGLRRSEVGPWLYRADDEPVEMKAGDPRIPEMVAWAHHKQGDYAPSIHMPRWASRITLRVTDVRVERLNDISEADAVAEGCEAGMVAESGFGPVPFGGEGWTIESPGFWASAAGKYQILWGEINGEDSWDANPWVWAVNFEVQP